MINSLLRKWFIITLLSSLPSVVAAARVLVYLPERPSEYELAQLQQQGNIVHDLAPLPWLALEIAGTQRNLRTRTETVKEWATYPDVSGHFAATVAPTPNDPIYPQQWHLSYMGVPTWWAQTQGQGVTIALLDSGVDPDHPDLSPNILFNQGYNFGDKNANPRDQNGHGTAMAGLMVASCQNGLGGCGVAPTAKIIPYKINEKDVDSFYASDLAAAILAASDSTAQILSLSLVLDVPTPVVQDAITYARNHQKIIVAATGNMGKKTVDFPAYLPGVIGVGALDKNGLRWRNSNYGNGLLISAPGVDLWTTQPGEGYVNFYNGTSAATALVSGLLALLTALHPTATPPELTLLLLSITQDAGIAGYDSEYGFGRLQAVTTTMNQLVFLPQATVVYLHGETIALDLTMQQVAGKFGDLFLRVNFPGGQAGERLSLFKVWQSVDSSESIPYNYVLGSPYPLQHDLFLPLFGTSSALLGNGYIDHSLPEGIYELLALLRFSDNTSVQTRQLAWIASKP